MNRTTISWCDYSINPIRARRYRAVNGPPGSPPFEIVGNGHYCEKIAPGCKNCYASKLQPRFGMPQFQEQRGAANIEPYLDLSKLDKILRHRKPGRVFWCDMTDIFGHWVPDEWLDECFATMELTPHLTHLVLTKRADRMYRYIHHVGDCGQCKAREVLPNIWLGVSASTRKDLADQVPWLLKTPAAVRFLSAEPLLEDISTELRRYLNAEKTTNGRGGIPSSRERSIVDPFRRDGVETIPNEDDPRRSVHGIVSASLRHDRKPEILHGSSQASVEVLSRTDSDWIDSEPYERSEDRQPDRESRTSHGFGAADSREQGPRDGNGCAATRRTEPSIEVDQRRCGEHSEATGIRGSSAGNCGTVRNISPADLKDMPKAALDIVIVGGESGQQARPCHVDWIRNIVTATRGTGTACFVKQLGAWLYDGFPAGEPFDGGRLVLKDRKGGDPAEWPEQFPREFPR